jgi:pimeloyl-ACP methyl ester carboxylesterase
MLWPGKSILRIAHRAPWMVRFGLRPAVLLKWFPRFFLRRVAGTLNAPDRDVLARAEVQEAIARSLVESLRQGARGHVEELLTLIRPWGFRLEDISSAVHLWHGGRDRVVPPLHCLQMHEALARSHCELLPKEGHFSLVIDHTAQIFARLDAARKSAA